METVGQGRVAKELKMTEMVDLIVETEPEFGASGFSVTGGGKDGIFIKEVLKDSRAIKALNLKEGDQILCAQVFFDNAKYEDVVKILQSAESYKVAFRLKRTVPSADVAVSSETGNLELKGPEAKKTKLTVKSISPVKKTKQLMKGKILGKEESALELDVPVDVEFAFPKFSRFKRLSITSPKDAEAMKGEGTLRHPEVEAELSLGEGHGKGKKKRLRFPGFRASESGKVKVEVGVEPKEKSTVSVKPPRVVGTKEAKGAKTKIKMPSFNLVKRGTPSPNAKGGLKDSGKVKVSADGGTAESKLVLGLPLQAPKVELDLGLSKAEGDAHGQSAEGEVSVKGPSFKIKMPSFAMKGAEAMDVVDAKVKAGGKAAGDEVEGLEGKFKMAQIAMPTIDIAVPKMKPVEDDVMVSGVEVAVGSLKTLCLEGRIKELAQKATTFDISAPKIPDVGISLPKASVEVSAAGLGQREARTGKVDIQSSKIITEGSEAKMKMPKVSLPEFGMSAKGREGTVEVASAVSEPLLKMPTFEVFLPKLRLGDASPPTTEKDAAVSGRHVSKVNVDIKGPQLEGLKLPSVKMPTIDIAVPKVTLPDFQLPTGRAEVSGPGDGKTMKVSVGKLGMGDQEAESSAEGFDLQLKMPKVSLPSLPSCGKEDEVGTPGGDVKTKFPVMSMPKFEIAVPGLKGADAETGLSVGGEERDSGFSLGKLPSVKMPSFDISAPKVKMPDINVLFPSGKAEAPAAVLGATKAPKVGGPKTGGQTSESSLEGFDLQFKMPKVTLPTFGMSAAKSDLSGCEATVDGKMPAIDLSVLKMKVPEVNIDVRLPKGKAGDAKSPKAGVDGQITAAGIQGPDVAFHIPKLSLPKFDISMRGKEDGGDDELKTAGDRDNGLKLKMPKFEVALPKVGLVDVELSGPTVKSDIKKETKTSKEKGQSEEIPSMKMPTIDVSALQAKVPGVDISLPSMKLPFSAEGDSKVDIQGHPKVEGPDAKVKMLKISLPKFGSKGKEESEVNGSMGRVELKVTHPEGKAKGKALDSGAKDADLDDVKIKGKEGRFKMPKIKMPTFGTSKKYEEDIEIPGATLGAKAPETKVKRGSLDADADGSGGKLRMPKVLMPSIGISVKEALLPRVEVDVSEADLKTYGGELKIPKVRGEAEVTDAEGRLRMPSVKMPAIDISMPKVKAPEVDLNFSVREGEAALIGSQSDDGAFRLKMPKVGMPKFGMSKDKEPGADASSPGRYHMDNADGKAASFTARLPKVDISMPKVKQSDADIDMDASLIEVEGSEGKFKMPSFTLPKISSPKMKAPELDIEFNVSKDKKASGDTKVGADGPGAEFQLKMPRVSLPSFGLSSPGTDADLLPAEKCKAKLKAEVKAQLEGGGGDVEGHEDKFMGGRIKMPKFRMMTKDKVGEDAAEAAKSDTETEGSKLKLKLPKFGISSKSTETEADLGKEGSDGKVKESKLKMSMFGLSLGKEQKDGVAGSGQTERDIGAGAAFKVKIPSVTIAAPTVKGPDIDVDISFPKGKIASIEHGAKGEKKDGKVKGESQVLVASTDGFKMPKLTMPDFGITGSCGKEEDGKLAAKAKVAGTEVRRSKVEAGVEGPGADTEGKLQMLKGMIPKVEIGLSKDAGEGAEVGEGRKSGGDAVSSGAMSTMISFKMPSVEISSPKTGDLSSTGDTRGGNIEMSSAGVREVDSGALELNVPKVLLPLFGTSKEKSQEAPRDRTSVGAKLDMKGPHVQVDALGESEGMLSKLKDKMSKVGVELPKVAQQEEVGLSIGLEGKARTVKADAARRDAGHEGSDPESKSGKTRMFGFSVPKLRSPEGRLETPSPKARDRSRSPAAKGKTRGSSPEMDSSPEAKLRVARVKMPSFSISWPKSKTLEFNGNGEADDSTRRGDWEIQSPRKKGAKTEEVESPDSPEGRSKMRLKLPRVSFTPVKSPSVNIMSGESPGVHVNGDSEGSGSPGKIVKIKLPKVEFTSPYQKVRDSDAELNLQLVKTEVSASKDQSFETSSPRADRGEAKGSKMKGPKITFSGFRKKGGEKGPSDDETEVSTLVTSKARTELVLLDSRVGHSKSKSLLGFTSGKSKEPATASVPGKESKAKSDQGSEGKDKSAKFKLPTVSLGSRSATVEYDNNAGWDGEGEDGATRHFKLQMPRVGFTATHQEQQEEMVGGIASVTVSKGRKQEKASI
ncbi:neuroblast differentiation-associated protein AHNAK-like [Amblyraja radiata]|uniref:neuroblast differentiation-associated protein AHNAK-like n=1 Tax=Amblyraja radiata TaxID=386614 RepID=UPI0014026EE8|nr:neuroblast differentiation-associated protein AHNAK-like [Amblyraja radiata]XP_032870379.1 neuroblast differentiation-associated protein AHNAK-like [Amblyraja radiata]